MKKKKALSIWLDHLSILSILRIVGLQFRYPIANIEYISAGRFSLPIIGLLKSVRLLRCDVKENRVNLGDLHHNEKQSLGMHFQYFLPKISERILAQIAKTSTYGKLIACYKKEKINIYFQKEISNTINSIAYLYLIVVWMLKHKERKYHYIVLSEYCPLSGAFKKAVDRYSDLIHLYGTYTFFLKGVCDYLKVFLKDKLCIRNIRFFVHNKVDTFPKMLVHFTQGVDDGRRSDFFWLPGSGIEASRICCWVDDASMGNWHKESMDDLRKNKINAVSLSKEISKQCSNDRESLNLGKKILKQRRKSTLKWGGIPGDPMNLWLWINGIKLFYSITIWSSIYRSLNIKIVFGMNAEFSDNVAKSIALEVVDGISIGVQRSTLSMDSHMPFLMYCSNEIFFAKHADILLHQKTSSIIRKFIVSGYLFDYIFDKIKNRKMPPKRHIDLRDQGKFIITLFDNVYRRDLFFSEKMMTRFYEVFLKWLCEDEDIAIIIKEKKPFYLDRLVKKIKIFSDANGTGRMIRLEGSETRFPVEVAAYADVTVGVGVSTAVVESALFGNRTIHCDLPGHLDSDLYKWGDKKIIFNDIEDLVSEIREFKKNPQQRSCLGDWKPYLKKLDPFCDGGAAGRIGQYMKSLLDGFQEGHSHDRVIRHADEHYRRQWGDDKVIDTLG